MTSPTDTPIFIIGLPRSGSTLWWNVLSANPDLASFTEVHFLSIWRRDFRTVVRSIGDLSDDANVKTLVDTIFANPLVPGLTHGSWFWKQLHYMKERGLNEILYSRIISSSDRQIGSLFKIIIEEATRCMGKNRAVVKFPVYPVYLGHLVSWWPEGKIIHISRDPRALAASKSNDPGGILHVAMHYPWMRSFYAILGRYFAVLQYILDSYVHARYKQLANYRLFFYEDLVLRPREVIREICEFCDLPFHEAMLNPSAGQASSITGKTTSGFDPARTEGWRKKLSRKESDFIKVLTKSSMKRFGYIPSDA